MKFTHYSFNAIYIDIDQYTDNMVYIFLHVFINLYIYWCVRKATL